MHNKLRRDLQSALNSACPNIADNTGVQMLLSRALHALGGPVEDNRPRVETKPAPVNIAVAMAAVAMACLPATTGDPGILQAVEETPIPLDVLEGEVIGHDPKAMGVADDCCLCPTCAPNIDPLEYRP